MLDGGKGKSRPAQQSEKSKDSDGAAVEEGATREVTVEVKGTGKSKVMYTLDDSSFEQVTLPWKKPATIAARRAEQEVGQLVIVTPGNMTRSDGTRVAVLDHRRRLDGGRQQRRLWQALLLPAQVAPARCGDAETSH